MTDFLSRFKTKTVDTIQAYQWSPSSGRTHSPRDGITIYQQAVLTAMQGILASGLRENVSVDAVKFAEETLIALKGDQ